MCTFSIWSSFMLDSWFKRCPSWQYWNKCQNIICIYWMKQFKRKTQINQIFWMRKKSTESELAIKPNKNKTKSFLFYPLKMVYVQCVCVCVRVSVQCIFRLWWMTQFSVQQEFSHRITKQQNVFIFPFFFRFFFVLSRWHCAFVPSVFDFRFFSLFMHSLLFFTAFGMN